MKHFKNAFIAYLLLLATTSALTHIEAKEGIIKNDRFQFYNLLNIKNIPADRGDENCFVMSDLGSWMGFALPENEGRKFQGAFIGPYIMSGECWLAIALAQPQISVNGKSYDLRRNIQTSKYYPGRLEQLFSDKELSFTTELIFHSANTVFVRSKLINNSDKPLRVSLSYIGGVYPGSANLHVEVPDMIKIGARADRGRSELNFCLCFREAESVRLNGSDSLYVNEFENKELLPGHSIERVYTQSFDFKQEVLAKEIGSVSKIDADYAFGSNSARWNGYLSDLFKSENKFTATYKYKKVAVKALITLVSNWRSPSGDLLHDGAYPSYNGFFGIWSWDSWKHASANVLYNPEMAKNEMRCLFDYQADNGMIPDFVGRFKGGNNWRDTKPPLSAWALMNIYRATNDRLFVEEMFDKVYKYHQWWYTYRDNNENGICEYGSTDGTLIAACWESGMDNGVRFDNTVMLKNKPKDSWSMNQENICLNSFLFAEKGYLAYFAELLGRKDLAAKLNKEAGFIKKYIQERMYDKQSGFFYDIQIPTGDFIKVMGSECWLPLWAKVATNEQAKQVVAKMLDESRFNSYLPLGTLDISHPSLRPVMGYWRGPVWIDQVYFAIEGLKNYGYNKEADMFLEKYLNNAQGLLTDGPVHENYNPLTGEALNCPNFGWSSAVTLLMLCK